MTHELYRNENLDHAVAGQELRTRRVPEIQGVLKILSAEPDDLVVDVGGSASNASLALARYFSEAGGRGVVFACDTDESNVDVIENAAEKRGISQHLYPVALDPAVPYRLPFKDEQIDCILSIDRVPWKLDPLPYLREFARILKPCGTLVLGQSNLQLTLEPPERVSQLPKAEDRRPLLRVAGFDIFSDFDLKNYLWVEKAMKPVLVLS